MRFKASVEREQFGILYLQIKQLAELGKNAVLSLSADVVRTIVSQDDEALQLFATLSTGAVFSEFKVESRTANVICVEVLLANFLHALKSGIGAHMTTLKLSKRGSTPFISITTQMVEGGIEITQDVPVRVLGAVETERYKEPDLGPVTVRLTFPSPRPVAAVVDRMRNLLVSQPGGGGGGQHGSGGAGGAGGQLCIEASSAARQVILSVRTEAVAAKTFFRDLISDPAVGEEGAREGDDAAPAAPPLLYVNIRHMQKALRTVAALGSSLLLAVIPRRVLILHGENAERSSSVTFLVSLLDGSVGAPS